MGFFAWLICCCEMTMVGEYELHIKLVPHTMLHRSNLENA